MELEMQIEIIREELLLWHKDNNRDFPWRHCITPYRIMVAEFMLQRTRASQVSEVYREFTGKYDSIYSLSQAEPDDIIPFLRRLGLYWRASHFIESARCIVERFNGRIPSDKPGLLEVPGVGEYCAGVVLACAFGKRVRVIDSNIARFLNRFFDLGLKGEIRRKRIVKDIADLLFDFEDPRSLTFALLDFTALVCKPGKPSCLACPVKAHCKADISFNAKGY